MTRTLVKVPPPSCGRSGYVVFERFGATVGRFLAPWACDSLFRRILAEYRRDGAELVMAVRHLGAGPLYPVVAQLAYTRRTPGRPTTPP